ncbi:MAG TPA: hypothetical protein VIK33_17935, partial [Anaerolineae bacterium]
MSTICTGLIEAGWLMAAVLAPLFFDVYSNRHVEADKLAVLHVIVIVMLAAWLVKRIDPSASASKPSRASLRMPLVIPALAIAAVYLLSTLSSIAPRISLTGQYVRPEGTQTMLAYVVVFLMLINGLRTRRQADRLLVTIVLTSLPVAVYAIMQHFELDPLAWSGDMSVRAGATLGNPIFLAAYLIMAFFLTAGLALDSLAALRSKSNAKPSKALAVRAASFALVAGLQATAILLSVSRGPWIGWLVGLFVFALIGAATQRRKRLLLGLVALSLAGLAFVVVLNLPDSPLAALRSNPYLGALGRIFEGESGTGQVRTLIWEGDARLMLGGVTIQRPDGAADPLSALRPLLGYGPDTLYLVFRQVEPPKLIAINSPDTLTVRSHNETWDTLVTTGLLGIAAYQMLLGGVFLYGLRWLGLLSDRRQRNVFIGLWIGAGLLGGLITIVLGQVKYLGVALPAGNLTGVVAYVVAVTLRSCPGTISAAPKGQVTNGESIGLLSFVLRPNASLLIIALLSGIAAHTIEIQFGQAIAATRVMFWVYLGLFVVMGTGQAKADEPERAAMPSIAQYALVTTAILTTLLFEFVTRNYGLADPIAILWRALTFDPVRNADSLAALGLLLFTWLFSIVLIVPDMARSGALKSPARSAAWLASLSLGLALVFGWGLAAQIGSLRAPPEVQPEDVLALHAGLAGLFGYFVLSRLVLMLLFALARLIDPVVRAFAWTRSPVRVGLAMLLGLAIGVALSAAALVPIHADIAYKLGVDSDAQPDAALAAYRQAVVMQPQQDAYYPAWAHALVYKATSASADAGSVFDDRTRFEDVLALGATRLAGLNRSDLLFAAQAAFVRARALNPLHPD